MVSKLIFDPQTLIDEEKENEQKKVKEVISAQEAYDQILEEENAKVRKQSDIKKCSLVCRPENVHVLSSKIKIRYRMFF